MVEQTPAELFHACEKAVIGYNEYVNCDEEHFLKTLEQLEKLVVMI